MNGWVWGVDTGSKRCGLAVVGTEVDFLDTRAVQWRPGREKKAPPLGESLRGCYSMVYAAAVALTLDYPPETVCFEQATGHIPNPSLMYHGGVTVLALAQALGINPWPLTVPAWKREHTRWGVNLQKKQALVPWGPSVGLHTTDEEELAAAAIALAARSKWNARAPVFTLTRKAA